MKFLLAIFTALILCSATSVFAQDFVLVQKMAVGGSAFELATANCIDTDNKHILFGEFEGKMYFNNQSVSSSGQSDLFIAKYTQNGTLVWLRNFGGLNSEKAEALTTDKAGNIYVAGSFSGTLIVEDQKIEAENFSDNFLIKYDKNGQLQYLKHIKADTKRYKLALVCDTMNNVYLAGSFYSTLTIDAFSCRSASSSDIFIARFDPSGALENATGFGGFDQQRLNDICCDSEGNLYLTGQFNRQFECPGIQFKSHGAEDIFLAKFTNLKPVWAKQMGGDYTDIPKKLNLSDHKLFLTGNFSGEVSFDTVQLKSKGILDAFVAGYDTNGNVIWATGFGGISNDYVNSLAVNERGDSYISGNFRGTIQTPDTTFESADFKNDIFVAKFDSRGNYRKAMVFGGDKNDYASGLLTDNDLFIYQTGQFDNAIGFNTDSIADGNENDIFYAKYFDCDYAQKIELGDSIEICANEYALVANPTFTKYEWNTGASDSLLVITESGTYTLTCKDSLGCQSRDSIYINLRKLPEIALDSQYVTCGTDWTDLDAGNDFVSYKWNTGYEKQTLCTNTAGTYSVTVTDENGCGNSAQTELLVYPAALPDLGPDRTAIKGETVELRLTETYASYYWSSFSDSSALIISTAEMEPGDYYYSVEITNQNGCKGTDDLWLSVVLPYASANKNATAQTSGSGQKTNDNASISIGAEQTLDNTFNIDLTANVYPNPNNGNFRLSVNNINDKESLQLQIISLDGKKIWEETQINRTKYHQKLSLPTLSKGSYFLHIVNGNNKLTKEIIVN